MNETLVGFRRVDAYLAALAKLHRQRIDLRLRPRLLRVDLNINPFHRIYTDHKQVRLKLMLLAEINIRRHLLEFNYDFCRLNRQAFACTNIEWNPRPTEIVHEYFGCKIRFGIGVLVNLILLTIARQCFAAALACSVLPAYDVLLHFLW
ncbi:hypothetical protein D3C77_573330 [compost metagenome]